MRRARAGRQHRAAAPWRQAGPGWSVAEYSPAALSGTSPHPARGRTALYLVRLTRSRMTARAAEAGTFAGQETVPPGTTHRADWPVISAMKS